MTHTRIVLAALLIAALALVSGLPTQAQDGGCQGKADFDAGSTAGTFESGGLTRVYRLFVPSGYDPTQPMALVLSLHGAVSSAAEQEEKSGWNEIAERENFVMAYPQGILPLAVGWRWKAGEPMGAGDAGQSALFEAGDEAQVDDVAYIDGLLTHLSDVLCIDAARIYVNGFSNGGGMTHHLACVLADRIAAIGTNAGAYTAIPGGCNPSRPVAVITFQGKFDRIVPYEGNERLGLQGVESWAADWAARNGCETTPTPIARASGDAISGIVYKGCADNASVEFYAIADGGHTWPGGGWGGFSFLLGKTSTDIDASETMWTFFTQHPMD